MSRKKRKIYTTGYIPEHKQLNFFKDILKATDDKQASIILSYFLNEGRLKTYEEIRNEKKRGDEIKDSSYRKKESGTRNITSVDGDIYIKNSLDLISNLLSILDKENHFTNKDKEIIGRILENFVLEGNDKSKENQIKWRKELEELINNMMPEKKGEFENDINSSIQQGMSILSDKLIDNDFENTIHYITDLQCIVNSLRKLEDTENIENGENGETIESIVLKTFNTKEQNALSKGIDLLYILNMIEYQTNKYEVTNFIYNYDTNLSYDNDKKNVFFEYKEEKSLHNRIDKFFDLIIKLREEKEEIKDKVNEEEIKDKVDEEKLKELVFEFYKKYYTFYAINEPHLFIEKGGEQINEGFKRMLMRVKTITKEEAMQLKKEMHERVKRVFEDNKL